MDNNKKQLDHQSMNQQMNNILPNVIWVGNGQNIVFTQANGINPLVGDRDSNLIGLKDHSQINSSTPNITPNNAANQTSFSTGAICSQSNSTNSPNCGSGIRSFCSCSSEYCLLDCARGETLDLSKTYHSTATMNENTELVIYNSQEIDSPKSDLSDTGEMRTYANLENMNPNQGDVWPDSKDDLSGNQDSQTNANGSYLISTNESFNQTDLETEFSFAKPVLSNDVADQRKQNLNQNPIDKATVDMIEKRMNGQSNKSTKKTFLKIQDAMNMDFDDLSSYGKIAHLFYHLNSKIGDKANTQHFELGVFFGIMIDRYPDLMELCDSSCDNLRQVFNTTRKHFKDILRRQGKLKNEDEVLKGSGTDLLDQLNLSSNSASSLFSNTNYTEVNSKCDLITMQDHDYTKTI